VDALNDDIAEYMNQLSKGQIQKAYRGIMSFMSGLRTFLEERHPDCTAGSLYSGYMDMTYFAFTPSGLRSYKLKIAIVYLHEKGSFEAWLCGSNRKIQAEYVDFFSRRDTGEYRPSQVTPGGDSIIEVTLSERPDFDSPEDLKREIEKKVLKFAEDIASLLRV